MSYYSHTNRQQLIGQGEKPGRRKFCVDSEGLFCIGHSLPNTIHRVLLHIHVVCNLHNQQSQHSADFVGKSARLVVLRSRSGIHSAPEFMHGEIDGRHVLRQLGVTVVTGLAHLVRGIDHSTALLENDIHTDGVTLLIIEFNQRIE